MRHLPRVIHHQVYWNTKTKVCVAPGLIPGVGSSVGFSFECLGYRHSPCHAIAGESKFTEKADTVPGGAGPLAAQVKRFVDGEIRGFCSCGGWPGFTVYVLTLFRFYGVRVRVRG